MNILVGNNQLASVGGTENYTYAIIEELLRQGHYVEYFTFQKGFVSSKIEELGVSFKKQKKYDLILANHNTVVDSLWRHGFTIQTCHGVVPELEQPSPYADAYVAISQEVHDHLQKKGYKSSIIWNGIDCTRFYPKTNLHSQLHTVLSLCQSEEANRFIAECCNLLGVEFHKADKSVDNVWNIEALINKSDLVVGIGRSLYDAIACGRCVISFDYRHYGSPCGDGYLTSDNIEKYLEKNCSGRVSKKRFSKQSFISEMLQYNPNDGTKLREFALKNLNISKGIPSYISLLQPLSQTYRWKKNTLFFLKKLQTKKLYRIVKKTHCLINIYTLEKRKEKKLLRQIYTPDTTPYSRIKVQVLPEVWANSIFLSSGTSIIAQNEKIIEISENKRKELLCIPGASDWRLLFKDSHNNIYTSPHASLGGSINPSQRGLYRKDPLSDVFVKVINLYQPSSSILTETVLNDDTIWTMCEDQNGYLYAGVYAHTIRSNPVIYKSIDGGLQWSIITNFLEINTSARHIHCITYDKNNDCLYCLVGEINTLYKSHDGGFHWIDTKLQTGGLFHQKCTAVIPTEHFRILGSDGPYNFEIYLTSDNTHYKTTYQGWAGVIFGFRQSDKTDNLYAFTKLDISVEDSNYWPPVNCNKPFSWLRNNLLDRKDWLIYNLSCKSRFPKDAIRPQHAAILGSNDEGKSWKILYIEQVGTDSNYGFWTAGTFFNGKCSFSLVTRNKNGEKAFTKTIIIDENN